MNRNGHHYGGGGRYADYLCVWMFCIFSSTSLDLCSTAVEAKCLFDLHTAKYSIYSLSVWNGGYTWEVVTVLWMWSKGLIVCGMVIGWLVIIIGWLEDCLGGCLWNVYWLIGYYRIIGGGEIRQVVSTLILEYCSKMLLHTVISWLSPLPSCSTFKLIKDLYT